MGRKRYIICVLAAAGFLFAYFCGYRMAEKWDGETVTLSPSSIDANKNYDTVIKKNTSYILETWGSDENSTKECSLPIEFIGLNREEMIEYIRKHTEFFEDETYQVKNVMLLSYSADKVVIRRNVEKKEQETTEYDFNITDNEPKYYIMLNDNKVVVYRADKSTVYMETGITAEELEENALSELYNGLAVKNISELYRILESYTS